MLVDEKRNLKLHCTIINTTYRRPRPRGARIPFAFTEIRGSAALNTLLPGGSATMSASGAQFRTRHEPLKVDLGSWAVDEVQICRMGSWGPEKEYVAEARCSIVIPDNVSK
jgi:activating signal cointegrator complex subunit 1